MMKKLLTVFVALPVIGLLLITILSYFEDRFYLFELMSHFRAQYICLFLIAAGFLFFLNRGWLLIALAGFSVNLVSVASIYFPHPIPILL